MSSTFGHHPWSVQELASGIDTGTIRLPDIQRPFVWPNAKVRDLVDSMYRGYPVGELMFWANADASHTKAIGEDQAKTQQASMQVVDGQQRLTSLYAVVKGLRVWREDYTREKISLAFNPLRQRFEVPTPVFRRSPEWIADITAVFENPITARRAYLKRLGDEGKREVDADLEEEVENAIQLLSDVLKYRFQVVQISGDVSRETVADIFVRINSEGVALQAPDFILTWLSVFWEEGRADLERWARNSRFTPQEVTSIISEPTKWTPMNPFLSFETGQILRVSVAVGLRRAKLSDAYNFLRGRDPRTREIDPDKREAALNSLKAGQAHAVNPLFWDEYLKVLERAGFRSKEMISGKNVVIYSYALWIIGRVDFDVSIDQLRELMARWLFMAVLTGRYSSSPETRMQEDLNRLDGLDATPEAFAGMLDEQIVAAIPEGWWDATLYDELVTSSTKAPAWIAYVASLNILDADVLLSTSKVKDWMTDRHTVKGVEVHHLFPRDYLKTTLGIKETRKINQVANYALVEWSDNIAISAKEPSTYWPQQVAAKAIEDSRRETQQAWHALPNGWTGLKYEDFLAQRRRLMASIIKQGFQRLVDPNYVPDLTVPEEATVDSSTTTAGTLELPTFEKLVTEGVIPPGTLLTPIDADRDSIAEVLEDGRIHIGEHVCDTVDQAAREDGADIDSGWDYWLAHLDHGGEPVLLAELREGATTPPAFAID